MIASQNGQQPMVHTGRATRTLPVDPAKIGRLTLRSSADGLLDDWEIEFQEGSPDVRNLRHAAAQLRETDIPVAFPTETVYGLGADATRSSAVRGIYAAKQRPSDNPLIVHVHSLEQLRGLLRPSSQSNAARDPERTANGLPPLNAQPDDDPIPEIYKPLIQKFWPGPLTIILRNPPTSPLAPEVTAGLPTFGARMPRSLLALALIKLAAVPLAAPSANASTRPSPTAAEHVAHDLGGRIDTIIDGGPCDVGVESTVVDGLSCPPTILRPGGVSIEQLRQCAGWEGVVLGYRDAAMEGARPRAPGMKYRHYSPRATVVLYEVGGGRPTLGEVEERLGGNRKVGIIRTKRWPAALGCLTAGETNGDTTSDGEGESVEVHSRAAKPPPYATNGAPANGVEKASENGLAGLLQSLGVHRVPSAQHHTAIAVSGPIDVWEIDLGRSNEEIARGLFSALRDLDKEDVEAIFVEGIDDSEGDVAAAVMNRLRKAAEIKVRG